MSSSNETSKSEIKGLYYLENASKKINEADAEQVSIDDFEGI